VDIVDSSRPARSDDVQLHLRDALRRMLGSAFTTTNIPWHRCRRQDRGDGMLIAVPSARAEYALDPLAHHLRYELRRHNKLAGELARLRLRMAVHEGQVHYDRWGMVGQTVNDLCRLLDAEEFRGVVDKHEADIGMIISDRMREHAIQHGAGAVDPKAYEPITITAKETVALAWIWRPAPLL
jgi:hypothetical protein